MNSYISIMMQYLFEFCTNKDVDISGPAIEIWNSLVNEDMEKRDVNQSLNLT